MDSVKLGLVMSAHRTPKHDIKDAKAKDPKDKTAEKKSDKVMTSLINSYPRHPPTENFIGEIETD